MRLTLRYRTLRACSADTARESLTRAQTAARAIVLLSAYVAEFQSVESEHGMIISEHTSEHTQIVVFECRDLLSEFLNIHAVTARDLCARVAQMHADYTVKMRDCERVIALRAARLVHVDKSVCETADDLRIYELCATAASDARALSVRAVAELLQCAALRDDQQLHDVIGFFDDNNEHFLCDTATIDHADRALVFHCFAH